MKWNKNLTKESYMHTAHKTEYSICTASSSILKPEISIGYQRRMERHMAFYQLLEKSNLFIKQYFNGEGSSWNILVEILF
ncbi:hypothetical protein OAM77_01745 [Alphaproteobacteria bacterium]|nr:hypothetical protein [Alphaproteobacteria bacterium]